MNSSMNIGVVGAGFIGEAHIKSLKQIPGIEVAFCEPNGKRRRLIQEKYNIDGAYFGLNEMLVAEKFSGIIIATPEDKHLEPVQQVAAQKIPILLEKPLATTMEDGTKIVEIVENTGTNLLMGFTLRWVPEIINIKEKIDAGEIGQVTCVYSRRLNRFSSAKRLKGRCTVNEYLSVHDFFMMLWFLGCELESIYTVKGEFLLKDTLNTPDFYWNVLRWKNGAVGVVHSSWAEPDSLPHTLENEIIVSGTTGSVRLSRPSENLKYYFGGEYRPVDLSGFFLDEVHYFVNCLCGEAEFYPGIKEGFNVMKLQEAAEESSRIKKPVPLSL